MRRLRPLRRRARRHEREEMPLPDPILPDEEGDDTSFVPFVPVSGRQEYEDNEMEAESVYPPSSDDRRRLRLPRLRLPHIRVPRPRLRLPRIRLARPSFNLQIRFGLLLVVILLVASGIFGTLLKRGRLRDEVEAWWPVVIIIGAVLWLLVALIQRREASFLGSAAFAGVGLSLLMSTQDIAELDETLMGVVLVTVGLGIVIRGLLLRQQVPT
jgi:hypothetical protein